jgi:hypothetical protein
MHPDDLSFWEIKNEYLSELYPKLVYFQGRTALCQCGAMGTNE